MTTESTSKTRGNDSRLLGDLVGRCTVLVADDSEAVRTALDVLLSLHGLDVVCVAHPAAALEVLASRSVDLVVQDMNFRRDATSGDEGVTLFHSIRHAAPGVPIILMTAWTQLETAVALVQAGASDYVAKPWDDTRLLTTIRNLLQLRIAQRESTVAMGARREARQQLAGRFDLRGIVYESEPMHTLVTMATQIARADVPVLITGPNGAGKEVLAEIIQANSSVAEGPFVKVNAGALPGELIESELFGAENGAFTGARARVGRFEAANGGTLFLDEIGNLSLNGQAKLLRVLQSGEFERVGSSVTRRVRVRVISATNRDLRRAVRHREFREDLYYRLNVIELQVPPLAARRDDILPLARHFLPRGYAYSVEAEAALRAHHWPGNVRELRNAVERATLLSGSMTIEPAALALCADELRAPEVVLEREPSREEIEVALTRSAGVIARAARDLGLSRQALYRRIEKLGLRPAMPSERDALN